MSYETPWRSLADSNPCFRRERDAKASIAVHGRRRSVSKSPVLGHFCVRLSARVCPRILDLYWTRSLIHGNCRAAQSS